MVNIHATGYLIIHDCRLVLANGGSMLQAFALQRFIQSIGHEAELVDYFPRYRIGINTRRPYLSRLMGKLERALYANNFWELMAIGESFRPKKKESAIFA